MNTLRQDSLADIVVFLVALPLCLGIAQASGLPPFVGLLTGIIGGLVVTALSPSRFAVSGPAAGLVTIVVAAIESLGSFSLFLMALVLARRAAAAVRHPAGRALYLAGSRQRHQRHAGGDRHPADYAADPRRARHGGRDRACRCGSGQCRFLRHCDGRGRGRLAGALAVGFAAYPPGEEPALDPRAADRRPARLRDHPAADPFCAAAAGRPAAYYPAGCSAASATCWASWSLPHGARGAIRRCGWWR